MVETIEFSRIGKPDLHTDTEPFEVRLGDGRVLTLPPVDVGYWWGDATTRAQLSAADPTGLIRRLTDDLRGLWLHLGGGHHYELAGQRANVQAFGARGGGETDDTAACQAAVDAIQDAGGVGTVFFPPGTYKVSGLTVSSPRIQFVGEGRPTIQLTSPTSHVLTATDGADGLRLRGLRFSVPWSSVQKLQDDYGMALFATDCADIVVEDCDLHGLALRFVSCIDIEVRKNVIDCSMLANMRNGVHFRDSPNFLVLGNRLKGFSQDAVKIASTLTGDLDQFAWGTVAYNHMSDCDDDGIDAFNGGQRLRVLGNLFTDLKTGINLKVGDEDAVAGFPVMECVAAYNSIQNATDAGIKAISGRCIILGNHCVDIGCSDAGGAIQTGTDGDAGEGAPLEYQDLLIAHNYVNNVDNSSSGIFVGASGGQATLTGNHVLDCERYCLEVTAKSVIIQGGHLRNATRGINVNQNASATFGRTSVTIAHVMIDNESGSAFTMDRGISISSNTGTAILVGNNVFGATTEVVSSATTTRRVGNSFDGSSATVTGTGFATDPTGTARWVRNGEFVQMFLPVLSGTSDATTFTITGIPAGIVASSVQDIVVRVADNDTDAYGILRVTGTDTWEVYPTAALGTWTASGTKALRQTAFTYRLV